MVVALVAQEPFVTVCPGWRVARAEDIVRWRELRQLSRMHWPKPDWDLRFHGVPVVLSKKPLVDGMVQVHYKNSAELLQVPVETFTDPRAEYVYVIYDP